MGGGEKLFNREQQLHGGGGHGGQRRDAKVRGDRKRGRGAPQGRGDRGQGGREQGRGDREQV